MSSVAFRACNERGSALVESIGTIAFATLALSGGLVLTYFAFAHLWLKHAAYETSICLSTSAPRANCEAEFRQRTSQALPIGQLHSVQLTRHRSSVQTKADWQLVNKMNLVIDDVRPLPLLGAQRLR